MANKTTLKIKINKTLLNKLEDKGLEKTMEDTGNGVIRSIKLTQKVPYDTGKLEKSIKLKVSKNKKGQVIFSIEFETPYARRLYYHPEYHFQKTHNKNAQAYWLEEYRGHKGKGQDKIKNLFIKHYKKNGGL